MTKRILSLALCAALMLALLIPAAMAEEIAEDNTMYVYTENKADLNVRDVPNGEIIGALKYGEKVQIVSLINDNWAMIVYGDGIGCVNRRFLAPIETSELEALLSKNDHYTGDTVADINAEFASAVAVEPYRISIRPARVSSVVNLRWIPSETGMIIAQYKATEKLTVLKELDHYLQVQDTDTGDVGYINRQFAVK